MKLKTLAWIQIILGISFLVDGIWIDFSAGMWFTQMGEKGLSFGVGLFALLTGLYNLKNKKK